MWIELSPGLKYVLYGIGRIGDFGGKIQPLPNFHSPRKPVPAWPAFTNNEAVDSANRAEHLAQLENYSRSERKRLEDEMRIWIRFHRGRHPSLKATVSP